MPKVHFVKSARKDNPVCKAGQSYYWWKFRYGGKRYSLTYPKRWELTQSPFYQSLWPLEDGFESDINGAETPEDLQSIVEQFCSELEMLRDECQASLENMPEHLQDTSESGIQLTERIEALEEWQSELENVDFELEEEDDEDALDNLKEEILGFSPGL